MRIKNKERRITLLKATTNIILEASEQLAYNGPLFKKMFEISNDIKSDELMIENILWFGT